MAQSIPVPEDATSNINIVLGANSYNLIFRFNSRETFNTNGRWYFDLYTESGEPIKLGIKVMENQKLLGRYKLDAFSGDIYCLQSNFGQVRFLTRDNLGIDKEYELVYFSQEELDEILV
jgi:hypothetical protein